MQIKIKFIIFLSIALMSSNIIFAQDVKSVDVKALPQSDIQKAQKAMQDAGLSPQDAANIARQKGATEQQIQDFESRIQDGSSQSLTDSLRQTSTLIQEAQVIEKSQRQTGYELRSQIFGAYLFNNKNLTFNPNINIQTPKNYEIGIGDQIIINIWGNSQNNYQLTVNTNGQILIPDVGPVYIAGSTFQEAENRVIQRLTAIYSDMGGNNPQTFAQVNMGQLRSIQVNLLGEVTAPGTYTLPVTATVFNGLYLSGGPNQIGSFRNINIIRNNKVFKTIDIYKFLVNADPSENILLKDDDIIFIPAAEKRVEVNGEFKRNGIFELKEGEMLSDLIRFAGGFTENSYLSKIQIYRKTQQGFQISDIAFAQLTSTPLLNGDEIRNKQILNYIREPSNNIRSSFPSRRI
jgi:protein involved in polysaccharide export with SLBB domain